MLQHAMLHHAMVHVFHELALSSADACAAVFHWATIIIILVAQCP